MVPYGIASDFYFSGHCGFMTLVILERFKSEKNRRIMQIHFFFLAYIATILIVFRVHYSVGRVFVYV